MIFFSFPSSNLLLDIQAENMSPLRQKLPDESDSQYGKHGGDRIMEALNGQTLDDLNEGNACIEDTEKNYTFF